ncbi:MAG: lipopolysaccharide biosynthesis protein [Verrucomicrobiota bacterium]
MNHAAAAQSRTRAMGLAVVSSLVSKGGTALLMLVSIPLAFKVLGEERFGVYGVVQTMMWFITMSDLGMGPGITRRIAGAVARGDREEETAAVACGFFITLGFALVSAGLFATLMLTVPVTTLFGDGFAPVADELTRNLWLSGLMFLAMLVVNMLERSREGYQEIHIGNAFGAAQNLIAAALLFFGVQHWPTVTFLLLSIYGVQAVMMTANAGFLVWQRPWLWPRWSRMQGGLARQMMAEGLALFVAGSVAPIFQREGTKWLLGQMEGPGAVGRYTIMIQLGFFLYGFVFMLSRPLWPAVADAVARGDLDWVRAARTRMRWWFLPMAGLTVAGFTVLGPWVTDHWLGKHVELRRTDFALFSLSFVLMVWSHLHYVLLAGSGVIRRPAVVLALETVAVLLLASFGIHHYGLSGALAGNAVGVLLFSAWLLPGMLRKSLRPSGPGGQRETRDFPGVEGVAPQTPV